MGHDRLDLLAGAGDLLVDGTRPVGQDPAGRGQDGSSRQPVEQSDPDGPFEGGDARVRAGWGHPKARGGVRDAALVSDGNQVSQLAKFDVCRPASLTCPYGIARHTRNGLAAGRRQAKDHGP
jgi:hypothetical protein